MVTNESVHARLARLEAEFEAQGGRGVELAEQIDALRKQVAHVNVASTILAQLGGPGFMAMIGMKKPAVSWHNGVRFGFKAKARQGINFVLITLDPSDTYTVVFERIHRGGKTLSLIETCDGIYGDALVDCFERVTGLDARMPRIFRGAGS